MPSPRRSRDADERRFWSRTRRVGRCILWTGKPDQDGYGRFATGSKGRRKHDRAHRWIYKRLVGPLGKLILRHRCDTPLCVHLSHLVPGQHLDNTHDALARGRRPQTMTPMLVRAARAIYKRGESLRAFARSIGVSHTTVYYAAIRASWRHIR